MNPLDGRRLIVIGGAEKAGTTSLHRSLARSPSVASHNSHEFSYFVNDHEFRRPLATVFRHYRIEPGPGQDILAKSVGILHRPEAAARLAGIWQPDWRLVIQLRHPAQRAISAARYHRQTGRDTRPLAQCLDLRDPMANPYLRRSDYEPDLRRLFDLFGRRCVIVRSLEGEGVGAAAIDSLAAELGLEMPARLGSTELVVNATTGSGPLIRLRRPLRGAIPAPVRNLVPSPIQRRFWEWAASVGRPAEPAETATAEQRHAIERWAEGPIARLEQLLNRPIPEWVR